MDYYKQHLEAVVKQFNSNIKDGLDENTIRSARKKVGKNVLFA